MPLRLAAAALLLLTASAALAQPFVVEPPRLRVARGERPIEIASLDVRVVIHGLHAETTETLVFSNPNHRALEGELEFPLPDGATVSGFALDVGGQLVDAVVVSKQKARLVLEAEIRKGVDPGLVEQVRGNVHRARVYPIPANGTRTVRLRWVSELSTRGEEAAYHLPLPYGRPLPKVSMRVEVVRAPAPPEASGGFGRIALARWEDRWVGEARFDGAAASRDLLVRLPRVPTQHVSVEPAGNGEAFFAVTDVVPQAGPRAPAPRRIALAWDASGSRDRESTDREIAFLRALLAAWPGAAVDLVVVRNRAEPARAFAAGDGGKKLEAALRALPADGGTALGTLDLRRAALPGAGDDLWIVASDGLVTLGEALPGSGDVPVFAVTGASAADRGLLRHLAAQSGGDLVDLVSQDPAAAAASMAVLRPRLVQALASPAGAVADLQISPRADRGRVHVTGRLLAGEAELTLVYAAGRSVVERRSVRIRRSDAARAGEGAGPVATAWAQARAEALGIFPDRNEKELLALGRRFGLVTAGTSLLVLETLEQHLEHGIEPAASRVALRAEYLARAGAIARQHRDEEKARLERVVGEWKERVRWWETRFDAPAGWKWKEEVRTERRRAAMAVRDEAPAGYAAPAPMAAMEAAPAQSRALRAAAPAKAMGEPKGGGTEASISVKPWDPKVPYLEPLRRAAPGAAYAAYLAERARNAGPAFFLDCAGFFLRSGEKALGIRVLTNLAELRIDDAALLRVLAWRLAEAGELDLAAGVLEKVLLLRPEEPQSRRDLALILADRAEAKGRPADAARAVELLWEVGRTTWDRFPEVEIIALMELNRVLARAERRGWGEVARAPQVDGRLRKLLDLDLRVSLSWDADLTDVDLHLLEPTGEHAFYGHQRTRIGGLVSHDITGGYGPEEYVVRRAEKGAYAVKVHYYGSGQQTLVGPATMIATVYTNFGRPDEKREVLTLRLGEPRDMEEVGVVRIGGARARP